MSQPVRAAIEALGAGGAPSGGGGGGSGAGGGLWPTTLPPYGLPHTALLAGVAVGMLLVGAALGCLVGRSRRCRGGGDRRPMLTTHASPFPLSQSSALGSPGSGPGIAMGSR